MVLDQAGQTAKATKTASGRIQTGFASTPVDVGSLCAGSVCNAVAYASLGPGGGGGAAGAEAVSRRGRYADIDFFGRLATMPANLPGDCKFRGARAVRARGRSRVRE